MKEFIRILFGGCGHSRITWPQGKTRSKCKVSCQDCFKVLDYDFEQMRIVKVSSESIQTRRQEA